MSHHSDQPLDKEGLPGEKIKELQEHKEKITNSLKNLFPFVPPNIQPEAGATGKFPDGKMTPEDKGQIAIKVGTVDNKVVMDFGKEQINWIGLTPEEAIALGRILFEKADLIKYGS